MLSATLFTDSVCAQKPQPTRRKIDGAPDVTYGQAGDGQEAKVAARIVQKTWNPEKPRETCKVYHAIYAPDGTLLTKGEGGKFGHHRGYFVGWNKTGFGDKTYDFWHMSKGVYQRFGGHGTSNFLDMGSNAQVSLVDWCDPKGQIVCRELRGMEVLSHSDDHYVLLARSKLMTIRTDINLAGDPHHSGQQFRALQKFAEDGAKPVAYIRPEGAKGKDNDIWTNLDWCAAVLELDKGSYTVLQVDGPSNTGDTRWSTRPYGRFGVTRKATVKKGKHVILDQYLVVANGARDAAWCQEQANKLHPPKKAAPQK